jgi:O-methyltransferase involved in polyketide biosynthesis
MHEQNRQWSCACHPPRCLGVPRLFLTASHPAIVLGLHYGQGERCWHSWKLATSSKEKETYLATLYGKALDAAVEHPILGDRFAASAVARIDYDFKAFKLPKGGEITLPMRAWHFDQWTRSFLVANPEATVLHLGCGLDTRVYRIGPGPKVRWFDVDFPDVIALREQLYPERDGYRRIGSSVTDLAWLDAIPGDTPVLVVAEGLVMYLDEKDGTAGRVPPGCG